VSAQEIDPDVILEFWEEEGGDVYWTIAYFRVEAADLDVPAALE
jgi:hypothetical protein